MQGWARYTPRGPNSFIFMQFLAKKLQNNTTLGVGAPPQKNPGSATDILPKNAHYYNNVYLQ